MLHYAETVRFVPVRGLDLTSSPRLVGTDAIVEANNVLVRHDGSIVTAPKLDVTLSYPSGVIGTLIQSAADTRIYALSKSSTTITLESWGLAGDKSIHGTFTLTGDVGVNASMAEVLETLFLCWYAQPLRFFANGSIQILASEDTDLDGDGDADDPLLFRGIAEHNGHLLGWGFGDMSPYAEEETGRLGPNRPEILRWSHLGQPFMWRPENWIMVGTRGRPIMGVASVGGRAVVLKKEGAYLVYGSLEENYPVVEPLFVGEGGGSVGCVGPHAYAVHNGVLYWCSERGPMRWAGEGLPDYIGLPVQGAFGPQYKNHATIVVPVGPRELIGFFWGGNPDVVPPFVGSGPPANPPPAGQLIGWLWDPVTGSWVGQMHRTTSVDVYDGIAASTGSGMRTCIGPFGPVPDGAPNMLAKSGSFVVSPGLGVVRGAVVELTVSSFTKLATMSVTVESDRESASRTMLLSPTEPANPENGQVWYHISTGISQVFRDGSWHILPGSRKGLVRLPMVVRGTAFSVKVETNDAFNPANAVVSGVHLQIRRAG